MQNQRQYVKINCKGKYVGIGGIALGDEMTDIEKWLENYCALMLETFGLSLIHI